MPGLLCSRVLSNEFELEPKMSERQYKIGDEVRVTADATELEYVAADSALLGQIATISETQGSIFRLTGPGLPDHGTWVQAHHIEPADRKHKCRETLTELRKILSEAGYDSESMTDDLKSLVNDSQRPATEADEGSKFGDAGPYQN